MRSVFEDVQGVFGVGVDEGSGEAGGGVDGVAAGGFAGDVEPFGVQPGCELVGIQGEDFVVGGGSLGVGGGGT